MRGREAPHVHVMSFFSFGVHHGTLCTDIESAWIRQITDYGTLCATVRCTDDV